MNIVVLDAYALNPGDLSWDWLNAFGSATIYPRTAPADILTHAAEADAILTNKVLLGEAEFAALPRLRYVGVLATGYNIIDTAAAARHGIIVTNIPAYSTHSVAQCVFAHLLHITNRVGHYATDNAAGRWSRSLDFNYFDTSLTEIDGKTMGIIGFGRTGQATARIALAFGMKVLAFTSKPQNALPEGVEKCPLDRLFCEADVVSLHCPLTPDTHHLVDARRLALMKPTAILINTSRGAVVDEEALADALYKGTIYAAGLDVLTDEPPRPDCPLFTAPNCFITPHIAWATAEARTRLMDICRKNIEAFAGGAPINVVNGL